jgi:serine/threonine protein kinase
LFPQIFGKYVLEKSLAVGGMARVFLATLRGAGGFEKKLIVKQIRADLATDEAFVRRFVEEAKTTVELSHPNIVPVYELGVEQGVYYLAMELCDGVTLAELLEKAGALSPEEGAYVGVEIARALDYAHRKARIIHRDVTPRNVMIDEEGAIRLIDFGIAAPAASGAGEIFGSPGHMPPEQLRGETLVPATDVFAVAALLYEAWTKKAPFRRATVEASERALFAPVAGLSTFDRALAPLDELIASSLAPDPARRPQSAEELARAFRRFVADRDLGDLARNLGARVTRIRSASTDAEPSGADLEHSSSPNETRTFATRALDTRPIETPDTGTRKMSDDVASWSHAPTARDKRLTGARAAGALGAVAVAAAIGTLWTRPPRPPDSRAPELASVVPAESALPPASTTVTGIAPATSVAAPETKAPAVAALGASAPPTDAPAHVRVLATPQANVEVDGRARGAAPIADLALLPGPHLIRLHCGPLGETVSQNLRVSAGENLTLSGDFTGAHGRILVRRVSP